jgi:uncharacterized membrane protein
MQGLGTVGTVELLLVSLFLLALLVALIFVVARGVASGNRYSGRRRVPEFSATEALDARYAEGELMREEYLIIRDDITRKNNA